MSLDEAKHWQEWRGNFGNQIVDAVSDIVDPLPTLIDAAHHVFRSARHPRAFVRQMMLAK